MRGADPLPELLQIVNERDSQNLGLTRIVDLAPLMPRSDGSGIFEEGERFAGVEQRGRASAVLTVVPSPHITERVRTVDLIDALDGYIDNDIALPPGMEGVEYVSPQLIVWWRDIYAASKGRMDVSRLAAEPRYVQRCFAEVIGSQVTKAHRSIQVVTGRQPVVWGAWGHATPEERQGSGKNRGVPTNGHGHMHVMAFDIDNERAGSWETLGVDARLNGYRPWTVLLHQQHGESIARYIKERDTTVEPFTENITTKEGQVAAVNVGYAVRFDEPLGFSDAYVELLSTAGSLEAAYRRLDDLHRRFHMTPPGSIERARVHQEVVTDLSMMDIPVIEANQFADLVLAIKPTYSQLLTWLGEVDDPDTTDFLRRQVQKYERARDRITPRQQAGRSVLGALLAGTIATKSESTPSSVLNEYLSATYIWKVAGEHNGELVMNGYDLYINLDSTQSAPEILAGRSLRRSTGT